MGLWRFFSSHSSNLFWLKLTYTESIWKLKIRWVFHVLRKNGHLGKTFVKQFSLPDQEIKCPGSMSVVEATEKVSSQLLCFDTVETFWKGKFQLHQNFSDFYQKIENNYV